MKANELRIGNFVSLALLDDSLRQNVSLNKNQLIGIIKEGTYLSDPIPITQKWLLELGFEILLNKNSFFAEKKAPKWFVLTKTDDGFKLAFFNVPSIKYIHQLQNLYFSLTGDELTIK